MLKKLLKYDFKSMSKMMWSINLGILVLSVLASVMFSVNMRVSGHRVAQSSVFSQILNIVTILFTVFAVLAISVASMAVIILLAYRFYKNFFDNEGYLTFTLPVSTNAKLLSKIITSSVWLLVSFLSMIIALGIFLLFGTATEGFINTGTLDALIKIIPELWHYVDANILCLLLEGILVALVSVLFNMLLVFLAITIGSILSSKHKIIASVGMYFVINMAVSIIQTILVFASTIFFDQQFDMFGANITFTEGSAFIHFTLISQLVLMAVFCVISYIIIHRILERKLNLP